MNDTERDELAGLLMTANKTSATTPAASIEYHYADAILAAGYMKFPEMTMTDAVEAAWDAGFTACAREHMTQDRDPSHPITRASPHSSEEATPQQIARIADLSHPGLISG